MSGWLGGRILGVIPTLFGVSLVCFALIHAIPGDPARALLGFEATDAAVAALRRALALDRSWPEQYAAWLTGVVSGDLGRSIQTGRAVIAMLGEALGPTLILAVSGLGLSLLISVPAAAVSAARPGTTIDRLATLASIGAQSLPSFWLGVLLIIAFAVNFPLLPASGFVSAWADLAGHARHLALPCLTVAGGLAAANMRQARSAIRNILGAEYLKTAAAKGLPPNYIFRRHVLPNAAPLLVTIVSLQLGQLLGGVVVAETVFAWPGLGKLLVEAIFARDYPVIQGALLLSAVLVLLMETVAEVLRRILDPRLREA